LLRHGCDGDGLRRWHPNHDSVTVRSIVAVLLKNAETPANVVREAVESCHKKSGAVSADLRWRMHLTDRAKIPHTTRNDEINSREIFGAMVRESGGFERRVAEKREMGLALCRQSALPALSLHCCDWTRR